MRRMQGEMHQTCTQGGIEVGDQGDGLPALRYEDWAPTKRTLHMVTQMVGKVRLALAPALPEWLHACLYLDARGLTTGAMPYGLTIVTIRIDVFDSALSIDHDGRRATVVLGPERSVADIWHDVRAALTSMDIHVDLWDKPQETIDTTPFSANISDRAFDARHAQRFHRVLGAVNGALESFRSPFFGRSGVQLWWGALDLSAALFTGRHLDAPQDRGRIMRYDLDAEHLTAGFWPGDDGSPMPQLFAYIVPRPDGAEQALIRPEPATWAGSRGEWVLPWDRVVASADPRATMLTFFQSVYRVALDRGGWDARALGYRAPSDPHRT